MWARRRGITS